MAAFVGTDALVVPTSPMSAPSFIGAYGMKLKRRMAISERMAMSPTYLRAKCNASFVFSPCKPVSVAAFNSGKQFGASLAWDQFAVRDAGAISFNLSAAAASCLNEDYVNRPGTIPVLSRHRAMRTVVTRASSGIPYNFHYFRTEKKPKWWWRTLACIPYLFPLHMMSLYAEGAHQFLPFLDNFEILTDPFFGNQLPGWFTIAYCLGVYYLVVRRKTWPHFFRFHVIMALLLDNAIQIIGIVARWMPYWSKLDAPFWTVVACGLLFAMFQCIRAALKGTYPEIPFFSEAALMHAHLP